MYTCQIQTEQCGGRRASSEACSAAEQVCATAIARETGQTIVDARKRIWLVDSEVRLFLHITCHCCCHCAEGRMDLEVVQA